jgi:magnesium-protoporphyrin IX monomethyl ester (oxidative) cyclase
VFPLVLDIENPKFLEGLERLRHVNEKLTEAGDQPGLLAKMKRIAVGTQAAIAFGRLFLLRPVTNELPDSSRLSPAW